MKKAVIIIIFLISIVYSGNSQELIQPSEGKSIVCFSTFNIKEINYNSYDYLTDKSNLEWMESKPIKFEIFDDEIYLGKHAVNRLYYECDPGNHLFWVNPLAYIQADLLPNKTYVIYVLTQYIPPVIMVPGVYMTPLPELHPKSANLFSSTQEIRDLGIRQIPDSIFITMKKSDYLEISEVVPEKKRKLRKVNELRRKSKILYKYKNRIKDTIPKILPNMYYDVSDKTLAK